MDRAMKKFRWCQQIFKFTPTQKRFFFVHGSYIFSSFNIIYLKGDDLVSADKGALQSRPGTDYFERNCEEEFVADSENLIPDSDDGLTSETLPQVDNGFGRGNRSLAQVSNTLSFYILALT